MITGKQLKNIVPNLTDTRADSLRGYKSRADNIAAYLEDICPVYGITDALVLAAFIANAAHESGGFRKKEENMNYTAVRIHETWPSRFPTIASAKPFAHNREALANKAYGGRMGNVKPGDGYAMRGGGFMQITGRDMYTDYMNHISFDTVENTANSVRTDDYWAIDSSCWLFANVKNLIKVAAAGKFKQCCETINGGLIGYPDRLSIYNIAKRTLI